MKVDKQHESMGKSSSQLFNRVGEAWLWDDVME